MSAAAVNRRFVRTQPKARATSLSIAMLAKINLASIDVLENLRKLQKALFGAEAHSRRAVEGGVQVEERQKLPRPEAVTKLITNERQRRAKRALRAA